MVSNSDDLVNNKVGCDGIVEFICKQIQRDQASQRIFVRVLRETRQSHMSRIHALHIAIKNLRLVFGEVDWLCGTGSPASRACGFQKFRASSERLSMDSEALLVRFLAGKDFERLSEVEPASVSCA